MSDFAIGRRELYILPTRIGWYFSLILLALFAIAVKYDNQSAFVMLFILVSIGMVAMLYTHNNVIGLSLQSQAAKPVFLGETVTFPIQVGNASKTQRNAVWMVCDGFHQLLDLPAESNRHVDLKLPTIKRGYLACSNIILTSQYPIGIFFCWTKRYQSQQRCLVYPQPLDLLPLPASSGSRSERQLQTARKSNAEDYSGMKPYQAGDRLRDVHWPSLAKTQKLVTVQHEDSNNSSVNLSWFELPAYLETEDKLSQLCYWIIGAENDSLRYQLEMPGITVTSRTGAAHFHECLAVLALWE